MEEEEEEDLLSVIIVIGALWEVISVRVAFRLIQASAVSTAARYSAASMLLTTRLIL